jgi:hypothetical protein
MNAVPAIPAPVNGAIVLGPQTTTTRDPTEQHVDWRTKYLALQAFVSGLVTERAVYMRILEDLLSSIEPQGYKHVRCTADADPGPPYVAAVDLVRRWHASGHATRPATPLPPPPTPVGPPIVMPTSDQ